MRRATEGPLSDPVGHVAAAVVGNPPRKPGLITNFMLLIQVFHGPLRYGLERAMWPAHLLLAALKTWARYIDRVLAADMGGVYTLLPVNARRCICI